MLPFPLAKHVAIASTSRGVRGWLGGRWGYWEHGPTAATDTPIGTETSLAGFSVGDITITATGQATFTVSASGRVHEGPNEVTEAGLPRRFNLDRASSLQSYLVNSLHTRRP